ncbi:MAG: flavin reductase family protein [Alphaproteobacteria bacterium]|nr:flavin reductase family protein [Alphaproteobacteria bacterium]
MSEAPNLSAQFVEAMAAAASGVSVVTTDGVHGRFGLTVSAVTSVSAEPPLLLACINRKTPIAAAITANGCFTANLLSEHQVPLAKIFAGRPEHGPAYDFTAADWHKGATPAPVLDHAAATFECKLDSWHDGGTHRIFIGEVLAASISGLATLAYHHRRFGRFQAF